jgi:hypothetical protein
MKRAYKMVSIALDDMLLKHNNKPLTLSPLSGIFISGVRLAIILLIGFFFYFFFTGKTTLRNPFFIDKRQALFI